MILFSLCTSSTGLRVLLIIKILLQVICTIIPLIIIYRAFSTLFKGSVDGGKDMKKDLPTLLKNLAAGLIIFLIPTIINFTFTSLIDTKSDFISCINNASLEGVLAAEAREEQEAADKKKQEAEKAQRINKEMQEKRKQEIEEAAKKRSTQGGSIKLDYSKAKDIPATVLKNASQSNLSVVIADDNGTVLAQKDADLLREGGSTTKVFIGYAAVKLLDPEKDIIINTQYAQNMPYMGDPDVTVGQKLSVAKAATKDFPGSSNITTANIAIAIGKKYNNTTSDEDAYFKGMEKINEFLKKSGCQKTNLHSSNGVNYDYKNKKWGLYKNGISTGNYGMTASDLTAITILAMKDNYFASGISGKDKNGLFFIKSGTQGYKHGVWGFNHDGKRYYITILGFNFQKEGDKRTTVSNDVYKWAINNLI